MILKFFWLIILDLSLIVIVNSQCPNNEPDVCVLPFGDNKLYYCQDNPCLASRFANYDKNPNHCSGCDDKTQCMNQVVNICSRWMIANTDVKNICDNIKQWQLENCSKKQQKLASNQETSSVYKIQSVKNGLSCSSYFCKKGRPSNAMCNLKEDLCCKSCCDIKNVKLKSDQFISESSMSDEDSNCGKGPELTGKSSEKIKVCFDSCITDCGRGDLSKGLFGQTKEMQQLTSFLFYNCNIKNFIELESNVIKPKFKDNQLPKAGTQKAQNYGSTNGAGIGIGLSYLVNTMNDYNTCHSRCKQWCMGNKRCDDY
jgi:hypothetical protein